jgi:hypothetical protein
MQLLKTILKSSTILFFSTYHATAQVGIGTSNPNSSSVLHIESTDKGLLIPRVSINDLNTAAPITNPVEGLLVYNQNGTAPKGFYYWSGTLWRPFTTINALNGEASINVSNGISSNNGQDMELGGNLTKNTTISNAGFDLDFQGEGELLLSNTENPILRIHSNQNQSDNGGRMEFNESSTNFGYTIRHQTEAGNVNGISRDDGLWFEMKKNGNYTSVFGISDGGGSAPRMGVHTTSPSVPFHTVGNSLIQSGGTSGSISGTSFLNQNNQLALENTNGGSVVQYFKSTDATPKAVKFGLNPNFSNTASTGIFTIQTATNGTSFTDRLTINMDGNVGIGTTTPSEKLVVEGNTHTKDTTRTKFMRIDNAPLVERDGTNVRPLFQNSSTKIVERGYAYKFFENVTDNTSLNMSGWTSRQAYKIYVFTSNACGQVAINEFLVGGSNANNTWSIQPIAGSTVNGASGFTQVTNREVDVSNSRPGCNGDGSLQDSFNYTIRLSNVGNANLRILNTTGTFKIKIEKIFQG